MNKTGQNYIVLKINSLLKRGFKCYVKSALFFFEKFLTQNAKCRVLTIQSFGALEREGIMQSDDEHMEMCRRYTVQQPAAN